MPGIARPGDAAAAPKAPRRFHHGNLRQALLDAALAEPDLEVLSLHRLAAAAGVSPAAIYRHFASRDDLLDEIARLGFDRLEARFAAAFDLARPPTDASEAVGRLARLAEAYLGFADDEPALWRLMFGRQAVRYRANARPQGRRHSCDYLPAALHGLYLAGRIPRPPDPGDARFAWSAIHGICMLRSGGVPAAQGAPEPLARDLAARVVRSLQAPACSGPMPPGCRRPDPR